MKVFKYITLLILLFFTSCVKEMLFDLPPKESLTRIFVKINWEKVDENAIDNEFLVSVVEDNTLLMSNNQPDTFLVNPGTYDVYVYTKLNGFTYNNEISSMNINESGIITTDLSNKFFSAVAKDIVANKGEITKVDIKPKQNTGQIKIFFNIPDSILNFVLDIAGELNNVAHSFNMKTQIEEGAGTVLLNLMDTTAINIFGFIEERQMLKIKMSYRYRPLREALIDLSSKLVDFNTNKEQEKRLVINYQDVFY